MIPSRSDYVALSDAPGPDGGPGMELHIRYPQTTVETLKEAREHLVQSLRDAGLSPDVAVWKVEPPGNSNHYAGSCRMHASPEFGMLNSWGRMHAVPNVAVADSSVFTTNPEKNPVLTSMTLAARAADRLAGDLRSGDL
jgi:choline dehydrogenase-like flavoprotein